LRRSRAVPDCLLGSGGTLKPRVLITGASGHLGYHVASIALGEGLEVHLLVRRANVNVDSLAARGAVAHVVDFARPESYVEVMRGSDVLFHAAATNTIETAHAASVLEGTSGLAEQVLTAALDCGVPTIVCTSSVVVLGRSISPHRLITEDDRNTAPESPYVKGKIQTEQLCERLIRERGADIRRVYPSWLIGPHDPRGTPPQQVIADYLRRGQSFYFEGGVSVASVEEVARAHLAAWRSGEPRGTYILAGENVTFQQLFDCLADLTGRKRPAISVPKPALVWGATILERAARLAGVKPIVDPVYIRAGVSRFSWYDSSKAIANLNYRIRPVRDVLAEGVLMERKRMAGTYRLFRKSGTRAEKALSPLLLTGVPGWLGNQFVESLLKTTDRPVHLLVEPGQQDLLDLPDNFKVFPFDLTKAGDLSPALEGVATVMHLAAAIYPKRIATLYEVNTEGTRMLVDACIENGVRRFLFASTDSVCGHGSPAQRIFDENTPDSPYGAYGRSKWLAEQYINERAQAGLLDTTILRGFWFFGPFGSARQRQFLRMMRRRYQIVFGNGRNYRSITHVDNMAAAFLQAENAQASFGKTYWIGDPKANYTVNDIYEALCRASGSAYRPVYIPPVVCAAMRALDQAMNGLGWLDATVYGIGKFDLDIAGRIDAAVRDFQFEPPVTFEQYVRELSEDGGDK
jgi:dihydroflavonol-4-reductase